MTLDQPMLAIGIQARLSSTRLPRKITLPFCGSSIVEHIYKNWSYQFKQFPVYILAPSDEISDPFWRNLPQSINVYFGHPTNLLKRYSGFAKLVGAKNVMRITADNPFMHLDVVNNSIEYFMNNNLDYLSSKSDDGANTPIGIGIEIFDAAVLSSLASTIRDPNLQEHVSEAFLYDNQIKSFVLKDPILADNQSMNNLTLNNQSFTIDYYSQYVYLSGLR